MTRTKGHWLASLAIIIAGEAIFMLPFLIPRLYRPLLLEAWGLSNTDIGAAFSAYGLSSMASYILGGHFADKYQPRLLMCVSLVATAIAGFILFHSHSAQALIFAYFFFGISTIFLMWGALIKVTHVTGGEENRSTAMGILDSGRGLIAAIMSSALVYIVALFFTENEINNSPKGAVEVVYWVVIIFTLAIAALVWWSLKGVETSGTKQTEVWQLKNAIEILRRKEIWLISMIILSSYCGYKSIDNFGVYLVDVQKQSLADASFFTSILFWLRPISALLAGFLADRFHRKVKGGRFLALTILLGGGAIVQILMALGVVQKLSLVLSIIFFSAAFAYALRSIYFSIFGDLNIQDRLIGTTVGIVSFVGFMPDMFFGLVTGYLIDQNPGVQGFNYSFYFTGVILLIGTFASLSLYLKTKRSA